MKMPILNCSRCGKEDTMMVDAPQLDDPRHYCVECYAILFPPGWTDESRDTKPTNPYLATRFYEETDFAIESLENAIEWLNDLSESHKIPVPAWVEQAKVTLQQLNEANDALDDGDELDEELILADGLAVLNLASNPLESLRDLCLLIGVDIDLEKLQTLDASEQDELESWAAWEHMTASDHVAPKIERPKWLDNVIESNQMDDSPRLDIDGAYFI